MAASEATGGADAPGETLAVRALRARFGDGLARVSENRGQFLVELADRAALPEVVRFLRDEPELRYEFLVDVTGLDHYPDEPRFRALCVLRSFRLRDDIVLKVAVPEDDCWAPSLVPLFASANWLERECYDMFGIEFRGHPDLRRILLPDAFGDHPLRKDFPMEGVRSDREWAEWVIARAQREEA